ncbi:hypothetical protein MMC31_007386, partial [Peltigera leucophlebia]|nr:hypothetical protein [Peltigera leucophlebia]
RVGGKAQQHLEAYLHSNSLTSFSTVEDLFSHIQHIFGSPFSKGHLKQKRFTDLDVGSSAFNNFYREFTHMAPLLPLPPSPPTPHTNNMETSTMKFISGLRNRTS